MSDAPAAAQVTENGAPVTQVQEEPGHKVFAGNLAYSTTDEGLKAFFEPVSSDIITAQVILRGTRSAGYGFVALSSAEAAQKAVDLLDKKELDGRPVIVEIAKQPDQKDKEKKARKPKRRFGRRGSKAVPGEVSEAEANGATTQAEDGATPAEGADKKKKKKKARKSKKAADAAAGGAEKPAEGEAEATEAAPKKKTPRQRKPRTPRPAGEDPVGEPSKTMLFVANLGFNIDDAGLAALFTEAGITVTTARIVRRKWPSRRRSYGPESEEQKQAIRRSKGYGFVDVGSEEQQKTAIELLNGKDVGGRPIAVKIAVNTPEEESSAEAAPTTEAAEANERNKTRSRRDREVEAREEGLSKSLFARAQEEKEKLGSDGGTGSSSGTGNKALSIMMKMGFKPGQSLGRVDNGGDNNDDQGDSSSSSTPALPLPSTLELSKNKDPNNRNEAGTSSTGASISMEISSVNKGFSHRTEPLPLTEWEGKKGIGTSKKRGPSPTSAERVAKMAKMAEETSKEDFRDRTRREYQERRAEGRLGPAQRTCQNLDEDAGKKFNVLWLNPGNPETLPPGLIDALSLHTTLDFSSLNHGYRGDREDKDVVATRLRQQIKSDALQSLDDDDDELQYDDDNDGKQNKDTAIESFSDEMLEEVTQFLRLQAQDRLSLVLSYLRDNYAYCFWCGTQYDDQEEMVNQCPGDDEELH
ncbi:hypothetical protein K435DRAFT_817274 [Dendrothele bispora CBS 962.96]|uniref:RRM domain-containing protein n=1 Tax=Dendrothele bispora (strain CBS 962.96) TaxID=1314807 RepID=A0A4V4HHM4_DENBC|nr:hypothetical protein K435DRAFT_817274 [Dendrothele bispora CBS 962.96]